MPRLIEWSQEYETGIPGIDTQNRKVIASLQALDEALLIRSAEQIQEVVIDLLDYAVTLCDIEERLMRQDEYPLANEHFQAHAAFRKRTEDYIRRLSDGENALHLGHQVRNDTWQWIRGHIAHEDRDYANFASKPEQNRTPSSLITWLLG